MSHYKAIGKKYGGWDKKAPFGVCPVCKEKGKEIFPDKDSPFALFNCPRCNVRWNEKKPEEKPMEEKPMVVKEIVSEKL